MGRVSACMHALARVQDAISAVVIIGFGFHVSDGGELPLVQSQNQQQINQPFYDVCVHLAYSAKAYQIGHGGFKQAHL